MSISASNASGFQDFPPHARSAAHVAAPVSSDETGVCNLDVRWQRPHPLHFGCEHDALLHQGLHGPRTLALEALVALGCRTDGSKALAGRSLTKRFPSPPAAIPSIKPSVFHLRYRVFISSFQVRPNKIRRTAEQQPET